MPMWGIFLISENSTCPALLHASPEAFRSQSLGEPPSTGTTQVSHSKSRPTTVYAIRVPSGENTGPILTRLSFVNCTGSPSGSLLTYTSPGPKKVAGPRINVTKRPSGDSAGWLTESGSLVI